MPSHIECETLPLVSYGLENGRVLDDEAASRSMHGGADGKVHFVLSRWNEAAARRVLSLQWSFTTTPYSSGRATKLCDTRVARLQALILVPQSLGTVARLQALILVPQSLGTVARLQALILVPQSLGTVARLQALILVPQSLGTELCC